MSAQTPIQQQMGGIVEASRRLWTASRRRASEAIHGEVRAAIEAGATALISSGHEPGADPVGSERAREDGWRPLRPDGRAHALMHKRRDAPPQEDRHVDLRWRRRPWVAAITDDPQEDRHVDLRWRSSPHPRSARSAFRITARSIPSWSSAPATGGRYPAAAAAIAITLSAMPPITL